jgi:hypothetical protein
MYVLAPVVGGSVLCTLVLVLLVCMYWRRRQNAVKVDFAPVLPQYTKCEVNGLQPPSTPTPRAVATETTVSVQQPDAMHLPVQGMGIAVKKDFIGKPMENEKSNQDEEDEGENGDNDIYNEDDDEDFFDDDDAAAAAADDDDDDDDDESDPEDNEGNNESEEEEEEEEYGIEDEDEDEDEDVSSVRSLQGYSLAEKMKKF